MSVATPVCIALLCWHAGGLPAAADVWPQSPTTQRRPADATQAGPISRQIDAAAAGSSQRPREGQAAGSTPKPEKPEQPVSVPEPDGLTPLDLQDQSGQVTSGTAFNPAMSVIPNLAYYNDSRNGEGVHLMADADGFRRGDAAAGGHGGELSPGFNLKELEIALSGAVDPYFDLYANVVIGGNDIEVEEAYVRTRRLPFGVQVKAGRFLSDVGYVNRQHPHQWAFANQNLAYDLVLGGGLGETGVQVTWLPSLPVYLQLGAEALQGENEAIASYHGPDEEHPFLARAAGPRLLASFVKVAPDLGFNHALQVGGSVVRARRHQEESDIGFVDGQTWLLGLDAVYKFDSPKPHGAGDVVLQAEYLRRSKELTVAAAVDAAITGEALDAVQDGFYAQASYGIASRWTAAWRFDAVGMANRIDVGGLPWSDPGATRRVSAALTFDPTDFSRLRVQLDRASVAVGGVREAVTQVHVQLQVSLGVHGAHKF